MASAAKQPPSDEQKVARIVHHMNADHQDSLVRYLEHYKGLSSYAARKARLTNLTKQALSIATVPTSASPAVQKANTYEIKLEPALADWSEARPRVVAMDALCVSSLARSPITLKHYFPPQGPHAVVLVTVVLLVAILHRRSALLPGAGAVGGYNSLLPWPYLAQRFPAVFDWLYQKQPWIFWPLIGAHTLEATLMGTVVLRRHSVPVGTSLWFLWVASTWLEGFGNFARIRRWATAEMERREKTTH